MQQRIRGISVCFYSTRRVGVSLAFLGAAFSQILDSSYPDGIAALAIGVSLAVVAIVMSNETRHLLLGESADRATQSDIRAIALSDPAVQHACHPLTMQLGANEVLVNLNVSFRPELSAEEVQRAVDRIERAIRERHADATRIFIENESPSGP